MVIINPKEAINIRVKKNEYRLRLDRTNNGFLKSNLWMFIKFMAIKERDRLRLAVSVLVWKINKRKRSKNK